MTKKNTIIKIKYSPCQQKWSLTNFKKKQRYCCNSCQDSDQRSRTPICLEAVTAI